MSDGELPEGWAECTLGDLIEGFEAGRNLTARGEPAGPNENGVLKISAVTWGEFRPSENKALLPKDAPKPHESVSAGDLLISRANTSELVGAAVVVDADHPNLMLPDKLLRLLVRDGIDRKFLLHGLRTQTVRDYFEHNATGTSDSMRNLSQPKIAGAQLRLAPLPEQRRIAEKVEALLAEVTRTKGRLEKVRVILKRFRQSVLATACSGKLTEEWRASTPLNVSGLLRTLGSRPERTVADPCPGVPSSWAWVPFRTSVINHDKRRVPVKSADRAKRRGSYAYYGASGAIDTMDAFLFDGDFLLVAEDGANLLSRSAPIAFPASGQFWVNNHAHVVQPKAGILLGYLQAYLNSIDLQPYVTGTAQPKLTQAALNTIPVALPPSEEQAEIVRRVNRLFALASAVESRLDQIVSRTDELPQAILSKAFSGDLVPTEAELARAEGRSYETAEEMLNKLRDSSTPGTKASRVRTRHSCARARGSRVVHPGHQSLSCSHRWRSVGGEQARVRGPVSRRGTARSGWAALTASGQPHKVCAGGWMNKKHQ